MSSYIYGFAAGRFEETSKASGSLRLRYLGEGFSAQELETVFRETEHTLRFLEQRAGVKYADPSYSAGAGRKWHRPGDEAASL